MFRALFCIISFCLCVLTAHAKPISYKDGYALMSSYSPDRFDAELNYSVSNNLAFGVSSINLFNSDPDPANFQFAQANYLIKRWNRLESQANIFASLGIGASQFESEDNLAGLLALEADYETRRIYIALLSESLQSEGNTNFNRIRYRVGVAPYLMPFEALQTWIIAQIEYTPDLDQDYTVTPLIRFFYNNLAFELGSSFEGDIFVGTMIHF